MNPLNPHGNTTRTGARRYPRQTRKPNEAQIIADFAWMWQPWGGAPTEDILVRFGLPEHAFYQRLTNILTRYHAQITPLRAHTLRELCERKLSNPRPDQTHCSTPSHARYAPSPPERPTAEPSSPPESHSPTSTRPSTLVHRGEGSTTHVAPT